MLVSLIFVGKACYGRRVKRQGAPRRRKGPTQGIKRCALEVKKPCIRSFNNSEIIHMPRTQNLNADSLAHNAKKQSFHMDEKLSVWYAKS
ncbi:hypothetical protein Bca4012_029962 [Brassica carinata]